MDSLADVVAMAARLPEELQRAQLRGVRKAALVVTRGIRDEIRSATGGDSRLSGVGKRGARVGAKYDVKGSINPTALIRATGPLHLIERKTNPHEIPRANRRKKKVIRFKDGGFAARAHHPGTPAKKPFERGYLKTRDETGAIFDREVQTAIVRVLR